MLANLVRLQAIPLTFMVIPAIAAAVVGRLNSLRATVIGGLVIGVIESVSTTVPQIAPYRSAAPFVVAVLLLLWYQRHGLTLSSMSQFRSIGAPRIFGQRPAMEELGIGLTFALLVGLFLPLVVSGYWLKTFTSVFILALSSLSVTLLYAQLGMVSLCQYAMLGIGGWVSLRIAHATGLPFELSLLTGGVSAAVFGVIFGLPALRMRGLYLALVTLMIAGALQIIFSATGFPDGGSGFIGKTANGQRLFIQRPLFGQSDTAYFRYTLVIVILGFVLVQWHQRSRPGRAWALIRRSEMAAIAAGTPVVGYKVWAFGLSGFIAGISGGLLAGSVGQLDGRAFPASDSIMLFAISVMAGAYQWVGQIVAGLLLRGVPALLNELGVDGNIATIVFGAGLLHALITAPEGIAGQLATFGRKLLTLRISLADRKL
jgi:branched-chain amino acid transport system permease protein